MCFLFTQRYYLHSDIGLKFDSLFSRNVAVSYRGAIHFGHLHVTLDLSELQSQVLTTDGHQRAALPGTPQRGDLLKFKPRMMTLEIWSTSSGSVIMSCEWINADGFCIAWYLFDVSFNF